MKRFTIKAKGSLLGLLYTRDRVFVATRSDGTYLLLEYDRSASREEPFRTRAYSRKAAVMKALKTHRDARATEEGD